MIASLFIKTSMNTATKFSRIEVSLPYKRWFVFLACLICTSLFTQLFALQEGKFHPKTQSIDAMLYGVDIIISSYEGDAISYKAEIDKGQKVSIVEDARCVRFRNSHPVSGKITVLVPKDMKLDSLRIYSSSAKVNLKGVVAVYFVVSMCEGVVNIEDATFKTASFSIASSTCYVNAELTTTADFCFSEAQANLNLKGLLSDYNFFYMYEETSSLSIDGKEVTGKDRFGVDKKKRKRMGITQSSSRTNLIFVQ